MPNTKQVPLTILKAKKEKFYTYYEIYSQDMNSTFKNVQNDILSNEMKTSHISDLN